MSRTFLCRHCHIERSASEVVALVGVTSGVRSYLCRPETMRGCWMRDVRSRLVERVGMVDDDERGDAA